MKKTTALLICLIGSLFLGGCTNSKTTNEAKTNPDETQATFEKTNTELNSLEKNINDSYIDDTKESIKKDLSLKKITEFEQQLKNLPQDDFSSIDDKEKVTAYNTRKKR